MKRAIEELIMLADILDSSGFSSGSSEIDQIIKNAGLKSGAVVQFIDALKKELKSVSVQEGFPTISYKSLPEIFSVIDNLADKGGFIEYKMSPEKYQQYQAEQAEPLRIAHHMLAIEDDIQKAQDEIEQTRDYQALEGLEYDLQADINELEELRQKVEHWKTDKGSIDLGLYDQFRERYNSRRGQEVFLSE